VRFPTYIRGHREWVWALGVTFVVLNILDVVLSYFAMQRGATEIGVLYTGSIIIFFTVKLILACIIAVGLVAWYKRATAILVALNIGMVIICAWNTWVLVVV